MKHWIAATLLIATLFAGRASAEAEAEAPAAAPQSETPAETDAWAGYLDFAFVYSSAEPEALASRLREYGRETHMSLQDYITRRLQAGAAEGDDADEVVARRLAIAHLLQYLATGEPNQLEASVTAVRKLEGRLGRHENRYWYYYILAHRALEKGHRFDFVGDVLSLWLGVGVPLESPYETLETLSLTEAPNSGFAAALPYIYENIARLILIRSQQMGLDRDIDPLGAIVRLLADGRVGGHPDVIPLAASSKEYLTRIIERLNGPESDAGSLTFTLALFEASKLHDQARSLLASEGLSPKTIEAIRLASGAYQTALDRADTVQGECAVYRRVLRQLGEVYAAKQRLGVDPELEIPFTIEGAIEVYAKLALVDEDGWADLGYRNTGRESWIEAMRGLWEEIQETILNASAFYLARSQESPATGDEDARHAARLYERYLSFFERFATSERRGGVPDSAYFAAHEAAKGAGDAYLVYASLPTPDEIELATRRYRSALTIFPFDRRLWPALTAGARAPGARTGVHGAGAARRRLGDALALGRQLDREGRARGGNDRGAPARPLGQPGDHVPRVRRGRGDRAARRERARAARRARDVSDRLAELEHERGGQARPANRRGSRRPGRAGRRRAPRRARLARLRGAQPADPGDERAAREARQADRARARARCRCSGPRSRPATWEASCARSGAIRSMRCCGACITRSARSRAGSWRWREPIENTGRTARDRASAAALFACAGHTEFQDVLLLEPTAAEQSTPLGGAALAQRRQDMQRAHRDMLHFHTTLESLQERKDRNGLVLFSQFLDAYMGLHLDPLLASEWQSRHPELMALDANLRLVKAEVLIQMRSPQRVQQVIEELQERYAGREDMLVEFPIGKQGTLRDGIRKLGERKWRG